MPREMFDERIRLSDPEKFSWEKTMLPVHSVHRWTGFARLPDNS